MKDSLAFAIRMRPEDMTVHGLARLEREVLRDHPGVVETIDNVVADFTPIAQRIEEQHSGRALMAPVTARHTADWRQSSHPLLAVISFLVVVLPTFAFATSVRGMWDFAGNAQIIAVLVGTTAVLCLVKTLSTLRDRVWAGVMLHWAVSAAVLCSITALVMAYLGESARDHGADTQLAVTNAGTVVVIAFAVHALVRHRGAITRRRADLASVQPAVTSYLGELSPVYAAALATIRAAVATIDPSTLKTLRMDRDNAISYLVSSKGLNLGRVPLFMNKKELGELALFAVAEPVLYGGGPHPHRGRLRPPHQLAQLD